MFKSRKVITLILASGKGSRFGENIPKQFFKIKRKTILEYSIEIFNNHPLVDEIIIVSIPEFIQKTIRISKKFPKVSKVIPGGATRSISSRNGIAAIENKNSYILIHDSVRPIVPQQLISILIENVEETGAVIPCIKSTDTLIKEENQIVKQFLDRNSILRVQTPQCFKYEIISNAYNLTSNDYIDYPDDSILVMEKLNIPIKVIPGSIHNIKLTTKEDIPIISTLLKQYHFT